MIGTTQRHDTSLDALSVTTIRTLAMDAVQAANSGHPGTPMGMAPVAYTLWQRFLRFDPDDPIWPNRDRFVLSSGHASTLLYSLLHLAGVKAVNPASVAAPGDAMEVPILGQLDRAHRACLAPSRSQEVTMRPPRLGTSMVPRRRRCSLRDVAGMRPVPANTFSRITVISLTARLAPRHRRTPPPNGIQRSGVGGWSRKRSGSNWSARG